MQAMDAKLTQVLEGLKQVSDRLKGVEDRVERIERTRGPSPQPPKLEEGPRLLTNIVGVKPEAVACEMPVKVVFDDVNETTSVPKFTPA